MKTELRHLVADALARVQADTAIADPPAPEDIRIERARESGHGDFACNVAMVLARQAGLRPRELAERIVAALPDSALVEHVEVAGPGFINFFLRHRAVVDTVRDILEAGEAWGRSTLGAGRAVQVEFVSANPTGPLHIGHGRGAAYGAAVANLLEAVGFAVTREYYVNDAGRQMDLLALSVWLRYLESLGVQVPAFPDNAYRGEYVRAIASALIRERGDAYRVAAEQAVPGDLPHEAEAALDARVAAARQALGERRYAEVLEFATAAVLQEIRRDLDAFGVGFDVWYSERSLVDAGAVARAIERLRAGGRVYEYEGALWFRSTDFDDEKDRVLVRDNGQSTYFASDIAYHLEKFERGFEQVIDVWGADHHGHVARMHAALRALGLDASALEIRLVQFAALYRGAERVQMSTRSGEFVTLAQLCEEVGRDAARFFYILRKAEQHLDFDLELAKSQTSDNPVYYVQYAHARIHSVFRQLDERALAWDRARGLASLERLAESHEQALIATLTRYPEVVETAALAREPHQLAYYLRDLANDLHVYYNAHRVLVDDQALRDARLALLAAVARVLRSGLALLGVCAPERM